MQAFMVLVSRQIVVHVCVISRSAFDSMFHHHSAPLIYQAVLLPQLSHSCATRCCHLTLRKRFTDVKRMTARPQLQVWSADMSGPIWTGVHSKICYAKSLL